MKLLINQPGRHGDILICLPIAKWYSKFFNVSWLCPEEYHSIFRNIDYCVPVQTISKEYDKVIDLSFGGFSIESEVHQRWLEVKSNLQSYIIYKYYLSEVPLIQRWILFWRRDFVRENLLYEKITSQYGKDYDIVQQHSHNFAMNIRVENKVIFEPVDDFNVFDWFKVLLNSREIHCIDSVLCNFVEVLPELLMKRKFYYINAKVPKVEDGTLLVNNWRFIRA